MRSSMEQRALTSPLSRRPWLLERTDHPPAAPASVARHAAEAARAPDVGSRSRARGRGPSRCFRNETPTRAGWRPMVPAVFGVGDGGTSLREWNLAAVT